MLKYLVGPLFVFSEIRWQVIVCFIDIGGTVDHHCLDFLFIINLTFFSEHEVDRQDKITKNIHHLPSVIFCDDNCSHFWVLISETNLLICIDCSPEWNIKSKKNMVHCSLHALWLWGTVYNIHIMVRKIVLANRVIRRFFLRLIIHACFFSILPSIQVDAAPYQVSVHMAE
jgi:hypothetical protein